jgi:hypothetical protein
MTARDHLGGPISELKTGIQKIANERCRFFSMEKW